MDRVEGPIVRKGRKRRVSRWLATPLLAALLVVFAATPTSALVTTSGATATRASIGHGSYLITLTNTGPTAISAFTIATENAESIKPSSCESRGGAIICTGDVAPGASAQVCYSGLPARAVLLGLTQPVKLTSAPRTSCPLAGFKPSSKPAGSTILPTGVHPWKHKLCISTYKSWKKKHRTAKARQKKAERLKLHKLHGCPLWILK